MIAPFRDCFLSHQRIRLTDFEPDMLNSLKESASNCVFICSMKILSSILKARFLQIKHFYQCFILVFFPHLHATTWLLVVEQQLHSSHHLLADSVQKGVANVDAETQQEFDDLQILILDGDEQGRAAEGVDAVDVDLKVNLRLLRKHSCSSGSREFRKLIWIRLTESRHAQALVFVRK